MKLIFDVEDKPKFGQLVIFALQQMLAILAATIAVPAIVQNGLTPAAAMFGAGVGTLVYILFTKRKALFFSVRLLHSSTLCLPPSREQSQCSWECWVLS